MSKALIAFTALLGLFFSSNTFAASNDGSTCREKAEAEETVEVRFIGSNSCSGVGSYFTGADHCEVKATPFATCTKDQYGVWVGKPYYFSGCLAGDTSCTSNPDPDPDPEPNPNNPIYDQLNEIDPITVSIPCEFRTPDQFHDCQGLNTAISNGFYFTGDRMARLSQNDNLINFNVVTLSERMKAFVSTTTSTDAAARSSEIAAKAAKLSADATLVGINELKEKNDIDREAMDLGFTDIQTRLDESDLLQEKTHTDQALAKAALDAITEKLPVIDNIRHFSALSVDYASEANYYAQQSNNWAQQAANDAYGAYERINSTREIVKDVEDLSEDILQILENGSGGGSTGDLTQTNQKLDTINTTLNQLDLTLQGNQQGLSMQLGQQLSGIQSSIDGNHQGLSMQLGQQLSGIQSAIENSSGGGSGEPSGGDTGTHERLDTTNYELSELRKLLDSRTTTGNNSLAGIASLIQDGNALAQAQGQQLTQIAGSLDGVSQSISGLGESIEGLKEGFEGVAMSEGDFRPEEGVLSALGLTGEESIADLTDDPVYLDDYRHQYDTFLTGSCPENIPVQFSLLGKSYSFNLFYKPVCDFMEIAGTILNFAVWFGVPFIVFGSRRVS